MKEDVKNLWVEALRSGKFAQGRASLRSGDNHCCLGVLCEISGVGKWSKINGGINVYQIGTEFSQITLPLPVQEWADMTTNRGSIGVGCYLDNLNDGGMTFPEIADLIEQHWKAL